MKKVTKEQFYATVGQLDVTLESTRTRTIWRERGKQEILGETNGYAQTADVMDPYYHVNEKLLKDDA